MKIEIFLANGEIIIKDMSVSNWILAWRKMRHLRVQGALLIALVCFQNSRGSYLEVQAINSLVASENSISTSCLWKITLGVFVLSFRSQAELCGRQSVFLVGHPWLCALGPLCPYTGSLHGVFCLLWWRSPSMAPLLALPFHALCRLGRVSSGCLCETICPVV